jgi:hypothetical protein
MHSLRRVLAFAAATLFLTTIALGQLSGSYDIGGGNNDYANFTAAVTALYASGISDAVTFNVFGGDYDEQVKLYGPITGASETDTVKFVDVSGTARLRVTTLLASDRGVIHDSLASFVIFDGIDIYLDQVHDSTYKCLVIKGASNCIFRNAEWRGAGYTASTVKYGVYMWSTACNNNIFENIHFKRHNQAFRTAGSATQKHTNNIIRNCTIDSVWGAFYLGYTPGMRIYNNDIQLNGASGSSIYGVELNTQASGDTVFVYRNKFHNMTSSGSSSFIRPNAGAGTVLNVYNNWFYDILTTGTSSPYVAVYAGSGTTNFDFNSVYINDVASAGTIRGIYKASSSATLNIRNNIFYSAETSASTYIFSGLSSGYDPAILDYNAYYNAGGNANYQVFRTSSTGYATLAALQAATAFEDHGVEGDPGYTSATDLHIQNTYNLVSNVGLHIDGIDDDIDGDARSAGNPDIGADEYTFLAPAADYAVTEILDVTYLTPELTLEHPRARVANRGSAGQTDVLVVLFWDSVPQDTVLVSLAVDEVDTVTFDWTSPAAPDTAILEVQSFLTGDADITNDSVFTTVVIIGQPMHGTYDIGNTRNYANFSSAVLDLTLRGMDGAVTFDVYAGTYNDSLVIGPITGASPTNTIKFLEHTGDAVTITRSVASGVVRLIGADYVTLDGIDVTATGTCLRGVQIYSDADYNIIKNGTITGSSVSLTTTYGVHIQSGGNDYNTLDNLTISGASYGIDLYAASATVDIGNEVKNCSVLEGKYGIRTYYQRGGRVHDCDIQPGWSSAAADVNGLYLSSQTAGDTILCYNNRVHNIRTGAGTGAIGIYTVAANARIYNNFIYDFQCTGTTPIFAIRVFGGGPEIYFNSVHIGDVGTTGGTASTGHINGFFEITSTSSATLKNNIFQIDEPTDTCFAINRNAGTLAASDYNIVYSAGPGTGYFMGRDGTTNYPTLASWQSALSRDLNSLEGNPGYVSTANLHIQETIALADSAATPIAGITTDIDGDARRADYPDIGADEYNLLVISHDYAVNRFIDLPGQYQGNIPTTTSAEVQNNGSSNETDVPVVLFYNDSPVDTVLLSLTASSLDTVDFNWTPPDVGYEVGEIKAKAFCPGDGYPDNDSTTAEVTIYGGPMHGLYDIAGGNNDYATFAEAIQSLYIRGIDAEVIFDVYSGTYTETVDLRDPIPGASFTDRVTFRAHPSPLLDIVTITSSTDTAAVLIDSCDYVTFEGINVVCSGGTNVGYYIDDDADYVTVKNAVITGRDSTLTAVRGIVLSHDENDYVTIDGCTISGCFYAIMMYVGRTGTESSFAEIKNCSISGGNYNIFLDNSPSARCHHNMLQPSGMDAVDVQGVLVESQNAGDTVFVYSNKIFNLRRFGRVTSANLSGLQVRPSSSAYAYIYNNMIWGFVCPDTRPKGVFNGILCGAGNTYLYHNSIYFPDLGMPNDSMITMAGINMTAASSVMTLNNNIIVSADDDTVYAIRCGATITLTSDNNCVYGTSANFRAGYAFSTAYPTLAEWQALGFDANSVTGDPGFISTTDLHIDLTNILCNNAGVYISEVAEDIDGDVRNDPPDIGADEFHGLVTPDVVDSLTIFPDWENGNVLLRWTAAAEASSYKIYAGATYDFTIDGSSYVTTVAGTSYTHTSALTSSAKFYVVVASTDQPAR